MKKDEIYLFAGLLFLAYMLTSKPTVAAQGTGATSSELSKALAAVQNATQLGKLTAEEGAAYTSALINGTTTPSAVLAGIAGL